MHRSSNPQRVFDVRSPAHRKRLPFDAASRANLRFPPQPLMPLAGGLQGDQMNRRIARMIGAITVAAAVAAGSAAAASAKPILMPTVSKEIATQRAIWQQHVFAPAGSLQPPAPPCPENGMLPSPLSNCGLPEFPATTLPFPGNMAYWGGHVQTSPRIYIV